MIDDFCKVLIVHKDIEDGIVYSAHDRTDAFVLMTAHRKFRELDLRRVKEHMRTPIVIDGRRVFEHSEMRGLGLCIEGGLGIKAKG